MSVTFKQASKRNIERAIEKAKELKPRVKVNGFNDFTVTGSKGDAYSVKFSGKGVDFTAHCTCKSSERELVCYHTASAAPVYKLQIIARAAERTCPGCGANSDIGDSCSCVAMLAVEHICLMDGCGMPVADKGFCLTHLSKFETILAETVMCRNCKKAEAEIDGLCKPCMEAELQVAVEDLFGHA